MSKKHDIDERIAIAKEARMRFERGQKLAMSKDFKPALEDLLFAFDNGHLVDGWGGVRLSFVPGAIARLGKDFPPALSALRLRRDERGLLLETGQCDGKTLAEWLSLNRYLEEEHKATQLLVQVESSKNFPTDLLSSLRKEVLEIEQDRFVKEKNFEALKPLLNQYGRSSFMQMGDYEGEMLFADDKNNLELIKRYKKYTLKEAVGAFELACQIEEFSKARAISNRLLQIMPETETYKLLIASALKANYIDEASRIFKLCDEKSAVEKSMIKMDKKYSSVFKRLAE